MSAAQPSDPPALTQPQRREEIRPAEVRRTRQRIAAAGLADRLPDTRRT